MSAEVVLSVGSPSVEEAPKGERDWETRTQDGLPRLPRSWGQKLTGSRAHTPVSGL